MCYDKDTKFLHVDIESRKDKENADKVTPLHIIHTLDYHQDEVIDCVEVLNPLCLATCSRDMSIVLYDLVSRNILRTMDDQHTTWISKLRYHPETANLVSIGIEVFANVWAPESLVSKLHIGKLIGHKHAIIDG